MEPLLLRHAARRIAEEIGGSMRIVLVSLPALAAFRAAALGAEGAG
jgi:hypothetical protein